MTSRTWSVLGVPSSAAGHGPGLEKAPRALRDAGILDALGAGGASVHDLGDLEPMVWRSNRAPGRLNDELRVAEVLERTREAVRPALADGTVALVLGGECTLTIGLVAAAIDVHGDVGLVYVDGGQDLLTVADHPEEPIADATGVAQMLDLPGCSDMLASIGPRRPLLDAARLVFLGFSDDEEDEHGRVPSLRLPASTVLEDPVASAERALAAMGDVPFVLHIDVDVLDFLSLPAADVPIFGRGLTPSALEATLHTLAADPRLAAVTFVEFNPDHGADDTAARLVGILGRALSGS